MIKNIFVSVTFLFLLTSCNNPFSAGTLTWTAINVNAYIQQGDAHLISKNGRHILIDTGHHSYAKKILIPTLHKEGVKSIDKVLITHPHNDHYGGLKVLINEGIKIKTIFMNLLGNNSPSPWGVTL